MRLMQFIKSLRLRAAPLRSFSESDLTPEPHELFDRWFTEAVDAGLYQPEAMTLSTADEQGSPSSRTVLLKGHSPNGYVFYTNLNSRKGRELAARPRCSLLFHWNHLHRQVRITGSAEPVSPETADAYYASRDRLSQLGAWASDQSSPAESRTELEERLEEVKEKFPSDEPIPRPPHWSGFQVAPETVEFWQGRAGRLHDRFLYTRTDDHWQTSRLFP